MNNFPIYIVSKGRYNSRLTSKALEYMNIDYKIIVEEFEYNEYRKCIDKKKILILPKEYKENYDKFWDNETKTGPGPARNFAWDCSVNDGFSHHWVMDDNLDAFHRMNNNEKWECKTSKIFECMEDFTLRYKNIAIAGPNYYSFCKSNDRLPSYVLNTRIYSCLFINNSIPFRWRGVYNEDTDLSIRVLKSGLCTLQFNAFLQGKVTTQRMSGGNTDEFYKEEGTSKKSQMLYEMHPDITYITNKFNRVHHQVNYNKFDQKLVRIDNYNFNNKINNYGMKLVIK